MTVFTGALGKRLSLLVSLSLLASLLYAAKASPAQATFPGVSGRMAAASTGGSSLRTGRIYAMNADGTQQTQLTTTAVWQSPSFSPDGSKIVAVSVGSPSYVAGDIYTMTSSGTQQTKISGTGTWSAPSWSPDGTKVTAIKTSDTATATGRIYAMNADGTQQTQLTTTAVWQSPSFSPDGSKIVAVSVGSPSYVAGDIYTMTSSGTQQTKISGTGTWSAPSWQAMIPPDPPTITSSPAETSANPQPSWSFAGSAGNSFECKLERGGTVVQSYASCTSPKSFNLSAQADGLYTFSVKQRDALGNYSNANVDSFTLNRFVASPTIASAPADTISTSLPSWDFTGISGNTFECQLERGTAVVFAYSSCSSPKSYSLATQPDGSYSFTVRQKDTFGNLSAGTTDTFVLDRSPTITSSAIGTHW